jgi:hypothetical protein
MNSSTTARSVSGCSESYGTSTASALLVFIPTVTVTHTRSTETAVSERGCLARAGTGHTVKAPGIAAITDADLVARIRRAAACTDEARVREIADAAAAHT